MITKLPDLAFEILDKIAEYDSLTQDEIQELLDVDSKEVKYAIRRLQENEIVQQIPDLLDMRTVHYRLPEGSEMENMKENVAPELLSKLMGYIRADLRIEQPEARSISTS